MDFDKSLNYLSDEELKDPFIILQEYCGQSQLLRRELFVLEVVHKTIIDDSPEDTHYKLMQMRQVLRLIEACYQIHDLINSGQVIIQL